MRITSINLTNIGVFKDQTISFPECPKEKAEIHIFTGINGSGKSTLLKALLCGFDYAYPHNNNECPKDTNKFTKYLRFCKDRDKINECRGKITLDNDTDIRFYGCSSFGISKPHLHAPTENKKIQNYRLLLDTKLKERPKNLFEFALFAYSGYRLIDYKYEDSNFANNSENPLFQSLEFIKQSNPVYTIESWIKQSLLKRSYARDNNLSHKSENYNKTIHKLERAIGNIIGHDIEFILDGHIRDVNVKFKNKVVDFDTLPDGLKSIVSWLGDLCMRLENLDWKDDTPLFERNIILFLDEIENHLHIKWQRKVLPVIQTLLPNAQIFVSTHSPFIVNSIDDAWVYKLDYDTNTELTEVAKPQATNSGHSYIFELMRIFEIEEEFGEATQKKLELFNDYIRRIKRKEKVDKQKFEQLAKELSETSTSLENEVQIELRRLNKNKTNKFNFHD